MQGLLPVLAPLVPHLAEDAWQNLPWAPSERSVFQAGWFAAPDAWRSLPRDTLDVFRALLALRCCLRSCCSSSCPSMSCLCAFLTQEGGGRGEVNQVLETARRASFLGSGLEARVLLHVDRPGLAAGLERLQQVRPPARCRRCLRLRK